MLKDKAPRRRRPPRKRPAVAPAQARLIAFNKPCGVICQFSAHPRHATLAQHIDAPDFYPAGRLDTDSEGLLLLTNYGAWQARISEPRYKLVKTYWAQVEGLPDDNALKALAAGVELDGQRTRRARVRHLPADESARLWPRTPPIRERRHIPASWLEIQISEGKNRQVRRMTARVGHPCLRLVRVAIGTAHLFELVPAPGQWRFIAPFFPTTTSPTQTQRRRKP